MDTSSTSQDMTALPSDVAASLADLEHRLDQQLGFYQAASKINRKWSFRFAVAPAALTALATVSIGISEKLSLKSFLIVALVASGLATVLGAWAALFSNRKLWVVSGITLAELHELKADLGYEKAKARGALSQERVDAFHASLRAIVRKSESGWQSVIGG